MESGVWSRWRLGFVLGASLFAGACASAHARSYETTVADEVVMPAPVVIVPASAPAPRVVIPAPPPAPAVASTTAEAAPQAPFTPRDSPLLTMNDPRPHGSGPAPMDPLLQRRRGRITVRAPLYYGYGDGCGAYCAGYGPGYNAYSWYGTPRATWGFGIGAPYYGYGYGRGWGYGGGWGYGRGWGYGGGWGRGHGHRHHHGNHVGVRRIR